jgi:hypothetical protein
MMFRKLTILPEPVHTFDFINWMLLESFCLTVCCKERELTCQFWLATLSVFWMHTVNLMVQSWKEWSKSVLWYRAFSYLICYNESAECFFISLILMFRLLKLNPIYSYTHSYTVDLCSGRFWYTDQVFLQGPSALLTELLKTQLTVQYKRWWFSDATSVRDLCYVFSCKAWIFAWMGISLPK